jgi:hypothetical protein
MQAFHGGGDVQERVVIADGPFVKTSVIHDDPFLLTVLLSYEVDWGSVW